MAFLSLAAALLAAPSQAEPYRWGNVAMGGGGFVSAVISCPTKKNLFYARTDVGGAYRWEEATQSWTPITDWASQDQTGFLGTEALAIDPQAPNKVYILMGITYFNGGKTAVARSDDYGATFAYTDVTAKFKANGNGMGRHSGERLAVDPNKGDILFCGTRADGLFKSIDGGVSWNKVPGLDVGRTANKNGIAIVHFEKASGSPGKASQTLYAGVSRVDTANFYVSRDAGATWTPVAGAPTEFMPQRLAVSADGRIYITYGDGAGPSPYTEVGQPMVRGAIYCFDPKAGTWTDITPAGTGYAFSGISVDAADPKRLLATSINKYLTQPWGSGDRIYLSLDAGRTWTDLIGSKKVAMDANGFPWIVNHAIHWAGCIQIDPFNPERAFVTSGNGIFATANLGAATGTWKFMVKGVEETVPRDFVSLPSGPLVSVISDYDGFVHAEIGKSPAGGIHSPHAGSTTGLAFAYGKPNILVRSAGNMYLSENTGDTWTKLNKPSAGTNGKLAFSSDGGVLLWADGATLFRTADKGANWSSVGDIAFAASPVGDAVDSKLFYAYDKGKGGVWVSTDGGLTFQGTANAGGGGNAQIRATPGVRGEFWISMNGGGLLRATNMGKALAKTPKVSDATSVGLGKAPPGKAYPALYIWGTIDGVTGVFRSDDVGENWIRVNDDQHQYGGPGNAREVNGDLSVYGRVYLSTAGRGIAYGEPAGSIGLAPRVMGRPAARHARPISPFSSGYSGPLLDLQGRKVVDAVDGSEAHSAKPSVRAHGVFLAP